MTVTPRELAQCAHDRIVVWAGGDHPNMWSCAGCSIRFYPACRVCVDVGHRNIEHPAPAPLALDALRYQRLRVLGTAPYGSRQLDNATVLRFTGLDDFVDADIKGHPSRGEADPTYFHRKADAIAEEYRLAAPQAEPRPEPTRETPPLRGPIKPW